MNISNQRKEIAICFNKQGFVSPSEQGAIVVMQPVEPLGIDAIDMPHATRKVAVGGLNQQMIVIWHQAVGRNPEVPIFARLLNRLEEAFIIPFLSKDGFPPTSPVQDMIPSVGILDPKRPRHIPFLSGQLL
jgi:hypothetical protein